MGIAVEVLGTEKLRRVDHVLQSLSDPKHQDDLLHTLGALVETQTRKRISDEKTSPDGSAWDDWSPQYASTRHGNQSLLQGDGDLLDSIQSVVVGSKVHIGSPLAYAAVHQEGFSGSVQIPAHTRLITQAFGRALQFPVYQSVAAHTRLMNIPQREFLGISGANQAEIYATIGNFWQEIIH